MKERKLIPHILASNEHIIPAHEVGEERGISYRYYDVTVNNTGSLDLDVMMNEEWHPLGRREIYQLFHAAHSQPQYQIIETVDLSRKNNAKEYVRTQYVSRVTAEDEQAEEFEKLHTFLNSFRAENHTIHYASLLEDLIFMPDSIVSFQSTLIRNKCYLGILERSTKSGYSGIVAYLGGIR